jgi:hypothetical protein
MKRKWCCKNIHVDPQMAMSLALSQYHFSTPEIRLLMRLVLGHAPSGRTIKRLARSAGSRLRRGRPPTTPRVHKRDLYDLIEVTSAGFDVSGSNVLHFLQNIELQFGLSPRQYLKWVTPACAPRKVHDAPLSPMRGAFFLPRLGREALPAVPT